MSVGYELSDGLVCVTGLSWESASPNEFSQIKKQVKSDDIRACFFESGSAEDGQMIVFGTISSADIPFDAKRSKGNPVSLAGLLAASNTGERIIALQQVETAETEEGDPEPLYWFCAINNGQVVAESDVVGPWDEIEGLVSRYRSIMNDGGDTLIGDGVPNINPDAPVVALEQYLNRNELTAASIKPLSATTNPLLLIAAAVFFFGAVGSSVYMFALKDDAPEKPRISAAERQARQMANAEQALAEVKAATFQTADFISSLQRVAGDRVPNLPVDALGWELDSVSCTQNRCDAAYSNSNLTSMSTLRQAVGANCVLTFARQGEAANCAMPIELTSISDSLSDTKFALMSAGQKNNFTESLMRVGRELPEGAFTIQPPEPLSFSGDNFIDSSEIPLAGSFGVKTSLTRIAELREILSSSIGLGYTGMTVSLSDNTIEVTGTYYLKGAKQ
jgi:hypothetical protein